MPTWLDSVPHTRIWFNQLLQNIYSIFVKMLVILLYSSFGYSYWNWFKRWLNKTFILLLNKIWVQVAWTCVSQTLFYILYLSQCCQTHCFLLGKTNVFIVVEIVFKSIIIVSFVIVMYLCTICLQIINFNITTFVN